MDSTVLISVIGLVSAVVVAIIAYLQHSGSKIADKNSNDFRELIVAQKEEIVSLRTERDEALLARDTAQVARNEAMQESVKKSQENLDLQGQINDLKELVVDYRRYLADHDLWESTGRPPPPPDKNWRLREDLKVWAQSKGIIGE